MRVQQPIEQCTGEQQPAQTAPGVQELARNTARRIWPNFHILPAYPKDTDVITCFGCLFYVKSAGGEIRVFSKSSHATCTPIPPDLDSVQCSPRLPPPPRCRGAAAGRDRHFGIGPVPGLGKGPPYPPGASRTCLWRKGGPWPRDGRLTPPRLAGLHGIDGRVGTRFPEPASPPPFLPRVDLGPRFISSRPVCAGERGPRRRGRRREGKVGDHLVIVNYYVIRTMQMPSTRSNSTVLSSCKAA